MTRRGAMLLCCAFLFALVSGCTSRQSAEETDQVEVYFAVDVSKTGNADPIRSETREIPQKGDLNTRAAAILGILLDGPQSQELQSPFPSGTRLLTCKTEDGRVTADLSEQYGELAGMELTIADYCITLSLCQLEGVESVSVTVEGKALPYRDRQVFTKEDVLLSSHMEEPLSMEVTLYFTNQATGLLEGETRTLEIQEGDTSAERIMSALLEGPQSQNLSSSIPKGTKLLSASVDNGVCSVNLSKEFLESVPEDWQAQQLAVYSIVNSLTDTDSIGQVQLLVEGETEEYFGSVPIGTQLTFNEWLSRSDDGKRN
ncbi:GerMN domain-containing protein [Papillibacter cinnamivorans]|uniref:Germination protein M n=1 Tax=Papillibacter cinnamivorans DSM 12816 TaxID=1122930 RepID=A0A1W2AAW6_9FIRM|nr:GerMN domain-containing protein [Papillibacter cinnamivorans]SMC57733.1 germination protein M [Papillibacter cinnamivorans DSM 12816]